METVVFAEKPEPLTVTSALGGAHEGSTMNVAPPSDSMGAGLNAAAGHGTLYSRSVSVLTDS